MDLDAKAFQDHQSHDILHIAPLHDYYKNKHNTISKLHQIGVLRQSTLQVLKAVGSNSPAETNPISNLNLGA